MKKHIIVLLGGMQGPDGIADSAGISALAGELAQIANTDVRTWTWNEWGKAGEHVQELQGQGKICVIGYSGGGTRATWLANTRFAGAESRPTIDLMILLDPSPQADMKALRVNVLRVVNFHNNMQDLFWPGIGRLGGGQVVSVHEPEVIEINMPHLAVQIAPSVHEKVKELVSAL